MLDLPIDLAIERIRLHRGQAPDAFERAESLRACRAIFLRAADALPCSHILPADASPDEMCTQALGALLNGPLKPRLTPDAWTRAARALGADASPSTR